MLRMIALGLVGILFMLNWLILLVLGKDYSMGKGKGTIGQTMIYKNKLHKLQRKLKPEKQELKIGDIHYLALF
jgi:hypothetical protein